MAVNANVTKVSDTAIVINDFLTLSECQEFIDMSEELGYVDISDEYDPRYRKNHRVMKDDDELANSLYQRLLPLIPKSWHTIEDDGWCIMPPNQYHQENFVSKENPEGEWNICGLNKRFRYCKYYPGGHFAKHCDGAFYDDSVHQKSWLTLNIYLNGHEPRDNLPVFTGGETELLEVPYSYQPEAGSALVFLHDQEHLGSKVLTGIKYLMRSDVMYLHKK